MQGLGGVQAQIVECGLVTAGFRVGEGVEWGRHEESGNRSAWLLGETWPGGSTDSDCARKVRTAAFPNQQIPVQTEPARRPLHRPVHSGREH